MPLPPKILSVWGSEEGDDFLGSASLLDRDHVLTVKHMFVDCYGVGSPATPINQVYVADAEFGAGASRKPATLGQLHKKYDAAILKLDRPWLEQDMCWPSFMSGPTSLCGLTVQGHVVDPHEKSKSCPEYTIIDHDKKNQEWVLQNQTANGYSGGVLTCHNEVVGMLHLRWSGQPLARAICVSAILDWIESVIPGWLRLAVKTDRFQRGIEEIERLLSEPTPGLNVLSGLWKKRQHVGPATISLALMDLSDVIPKARVKWRVDSTESDILNRLRDACCRLVGLLLELSFDEQALREWAANPDRVAPFYSAGLAAVCVALAAAEQVHVSPMLPSGRDVHTTRTAVMSNALTSGISRDAQQDAGKQFYFDVYRQAIDDLGPMAMEELIEAMYLLTYRDGVPFRVSGVAMTKVRDEAYTALVNLADEFRAKPVARSGVRDANCPLLFESEVRLVQALRLCLEEIQKIT